MDKAKERARLAKDVEEFLAKGGKITVVKPAADKKEKSMVGSVWNAGRKAVTLGKA